MTSPTRKKFLATIQIEEQHQAIVEADDRRGAHDAADELFSACNVDGFELTHHTFGVVDVEELSADDPRSAENLAVESSAGTRHPLPYRDAPTNDVLCELAHELTARECAFRGIVLDVEHEDETLYSDEARQIFDSIHDIVARVLEGDDREVRP
jgi:hypothetical protein